MLYYSSIYPERDYFDSFSKSDQGLRISELLEGVALNHSRNTLPCFSTLESLGIILGNGCFETILIQRDPLGPVSTVDAGWAKSVVAAAKKSLVVPLWYCFSIGCRIYVLICLPRLREGDPEADATGRRIYDSCVRMNDPYRQAVPILLRREPASVYPADPVPPCRNAPVRAPGLAGSQDCGGRGIFGPFHHVSGIPDSG